MTKINSFRETDEGNFMIMVSNSKIHKLIGYIENNEENIIYVSRSKHQSDWEKSISLPYRVKDEYMYEDIKGE